MLTCCWLWMAALQVSPVLGPHQRLLWLGTPGDRFGAALAAAGDANGDGVGDLLVGAPRTGSSELPSAGAAALYCGKSAATLQTWTGGLAYGRLGAALAGPPPVDPGGIRASLDMDGDGAAELALGAPGANRVYVVSLAVGATTRELHLPAPGAQFGAALAWIGDVDGDGRSELAVGAPTDPTGGVGAGSVLLYRAVDGQLLWRVSGQPFDRLGSSVCAIGDVDGDGVPDLAVGAPLSEGSLGGAGDPAGPFNGGAVFALSGATGAVIWSAGGEQAGEQLGTRLALLGDVHGDGEWLLGAAAPGWDSTLSDQTFHDGGAARFFAVHGGAPRGALAWHQAGLFADQVAGVGDVDGDGRADVLLGAPSFQHGSDARGRVRLYTQGAKHLLLELDGGAPDAWFGAALAGLEPVAAEARFAVGAPGNEDQPDGVGAAYVFSPEPQSLVGAPNQPSIPTGGAQHLRIDLGAPFAGAPYLVAGSLALADAPWFVDGLAVPLALDGYFLLSLSQPAGVGLVGSAGVLDPAGVAEAALLRPADLLCLAPYAPVFWHAACAFGPSGALVHVSPATPFHLATGPAAGGKILPAPDRGGLVDGDRSQAQGPP